MSDIKNDGGLAFPFAYQGPTTGPEVYYGMTLRDWFAGMAMQGILASDMKLHVEGRPIERTPNVIADAAYQQADAMIAERNKA